MRPAIQGDSWALASEPMSPSKKKTYLTKAFQGSRVSTSDLQEIIDVASRHVELIVFEGCRTLAKQKEYVKKGLSKT